MDADPIYPLVSLPPQQGALVPVATDIVSVSPGHEERQADRLWRALFGRASLFFPTPLGLGRVPHFVIDEYGKESWRGKE